MQDYLLSVKLVVHQHIQVVLLFFNVDWHVDTSTLNDNGDRLCVVLVFQKQSELLCHLSQLVGHKSELDLGA